MSLSTSLSVSTPWVNADRSEHLASDGGRVAERRPDPMVRHGVPALFDASTIAAADGQAPPRAGVDRRYPPAGGTTYPPRTLREPASGTRAIRTVAPIPQAARDLLADASRGLGRAIGSTAAADRYATAHLAALRAAAAVLAARAKPTRGRRGSAWELMAAVTPEFAEWAAFFAAGSAKRQAAEAGLNRLVTAREADDMVRQVAAFLDLVEEALSARPRQGAAQSRPPQRPGAGRGQRRAF